eukprot:CAMPEP_0119053728 /NCGR_PEP_ID=MMETSP1177-20130426/74616_1 /TAXON_ID=2985 /ORGANISM="Ochromonas sp, Strain CCMP1899" /LENGTH=224 /DNA_ID=CAMNT_0007033763 /DNA_START=755 /DNA_END=1426 /DNA_ORIENTATION=-
MPLEVNEDQSSEIKSRNYGAAVKLAEINSVYGSLCCKVYEPYAKLSRGFFGKPHIDALISLVGCSTSQSGVFMIVKKCLDVLTEKLQDAHDYIGVLREGIPLFDLPPESDHTEDCCKYYESKLKHLLEFEDLKPEIFQIFREMGNIVLLLQDFSTSLAVIQPLNLLLGKKLPTFLSNRPHGNNESDPSTTAKSSSHMNSDTYLFQYVLNHIEITIMEFNLFRCW